MSNELERDHKPQLHCPCCRERWENVLTLRKSLAEAEAELARVREELEIEKARFPVIGSPLQKLGAYLADLLVEDKWSTAEQYLLAAQAEKELAKGVYTRVSGKTAYEWLQAYNEERERTERVARRAYEYGLVAGTKDRLDGEDEAVAQAMREGGIRIEPPQPP